MLQGKKITQDNNSTALLYRPVKTMSIPFLLYSTSM